MKTLKFTPQLCEEIVRGTKTSTWRLFDDKDLQIGDQLEFLNKETLGVIGTGVITSLYNKTLSTLNEEDWAGHERYVSDEAMYEAYRGYYGDRVTKDTEIKIITFKFQPSKSVS
jgi:hypothetical protein